MDSGTFEPGVGGDDGYITRGSAFENSSFYIRLGCDNGPKYDCFLRFPSINIPQGSTIVSAKLTFDSNITMNYEHEGKTVFYGNDIDSAVAPINRSEFEALVKTFSNVEWNDNTDWSGTGYYDSPDLTSIIQEIISREGWVSGNALQILGYENGGVCGATQYRRMSWAAQEAEPGSDATELYIQWMESADVTGEIVIDIPSPVPDIRGGGYVNFLVPSLGALLRPGPFIVAEMPNFNAAVHGEQDVIYGNIAVNVPALTAGLTEHPSGEIKTELPALTAALHYLNTGLIASDIPSLESDITASLSAQVEADLPMLTLSMLGGAKNEVELPALTTEMEGVVGRVGSINIDIPSLTLEMSGKVGYLGDINVSLSKLIAACNGNIGRLASVSASLPVLKSSLKGWAEPGDTEIKATMPSFEVIAFLKSDNRFDSCSGWQYD